MSENHGRFYGFDIVQLKNKKAPEGKKKKSYCRVESTTADVINWILVRGAKWPDNAPGCEGRVSRTLRRFTTGSKVVGRDAPDAELPMTVVAPSKQSTADVD